MCFFLQAVLLSHLLNMQQIFLSILAKMKIVKISILIICGRIYENIPSEFLIDGRPSAFAVYRVGALLAWQFLSNHFHFLVIMVDAFVGRFEIESRENYDGFMNGVGVSADNIELARNAKIVTEISKNGDVITISRERPNRNSSNSFRLGEETEFDTIKGDKAKVSVNIDGGKLIVKGKEYNLVGEIVDGKLKETVSLKGHTMSRISKKI